MCFCFGRKTRSRGANSGPGNPLDGNSSSASTNQPVIASINTSEGRDSSSPNEVQESASVLPNEASIHNTPTPPRSEPAPAGMPPLGNNRRSGNRIRSQDTDEAYREIFGVGRPLNSDGSAAAHTTQSSRGSDVRTSGRGSRSTDEVLDTLTGGHVREGTPLPSYDQSFGTRLVAVGIDPYAEIFGNDLVNSTRDPWNRPVRLTLRPGASLGTQIFAPPSYETAYVEGLFRQLGLEGG